MARYLGRRTQADIANEASATGFNTIVKAGFILKIYKILASLNSGGNCTLNLLVDDLNVINHSGNSINLDFIEPLVFSEGTILKAYVINRSGIPATVDFSIHFELESATDKNREKDISPIWDMSVYAI